MISIIIPVYNQPRQLKKCLDSIQKQTYDNYEIILVNDRSTTPMNSVVLPFKHNLGIRMEIMNNQSNHGASYSRNKGRKKARGEFLLFCDADVIMIPEMLEIMLKTLHGNPKAGFVYCSHRYGHKLFRFWPFDADKLKSIPYIHSTSLMRREAFPDKGWDENLNKLQDWDFWLTVVKNGWEGVWVDKVLFTYLPGGVYSSWVPRFSYRWLPFLPSVRKYKKAIMIVQKKHNIII